MTRMHYLDDFCLFVLFNPWFQEKPCFDLNECNHLYVASVFIGSSLFFSRSECLMYFKGTVHPIIGCIFLCVFLCVNLISHDYGWSICLLQGFFSFLWVSESFHFNPCSNSILTFIIFSQTIRFRCNDYKHPHSFVLINIETIKLCVAFLSACFVLFICSKLTSRSPDVPYRVNDFMQYCT